MNGRDDLNSLDEKISVRGYFERILREQEARDTERDLRYSERFEASEKAVEAAFRSSEKAIDRAFEAQRRVNDTQNEFRGALKDAQGELVQKDTFDAQIAELQIWRRKVDENIARLPQPEMIEQRLKALEGAYARSEGAIAQAKADASALAIRVSMGTGIGAIVITVMLRLVLP